MPKFKLCIARFPYGGSEASECVNWLLRLARRLAADARFEVFDAFPNDTPITMTRNDVLQQCVEFGMDYVLLVDNDIAPDVEVGVDPAAKPFFETAFEFLRAHGKPAVVAAPYCGPPPAELVYVFTWTDLEGNRADPHNRLVMHTREHAAILTGVQEVAALPTGLMLIDVRALAKLPHPRTYYEWAGDGEPCKACGCRKPGPQARKASTEDVTFTRDLSMAGVPVFCAWDSWAGHIKKKIVGRPRPMLASQVSKRMHEAIVRGQVGGEGLADVRTDRFAAEIALAEARFRAEQEGGPVRAGPAAAPPAAPEPPPASLPPFAPSFFSPL